MGEAMEVDKVEEANLPWVEKYRPAKLEDLVSHKEIIGTLNRFIKANRLPHLLFYGPPGTGKTSTILAAARQMYSENQFRSMVLELNASDDRGIGIVREDIVNFAQSRGLYTERDSHTNVKLVILDEADAMTKDAQNALRRVIEKYTTNVRFCIICNYLSNIIPAIQSRCTRFRFAPLILEQIVPRLDHVVKEEGVKMTDDGRQALLDLSAGDMRRVLNILQSTVMAFAVVNEANVYQCVGQPTPSEMEAILKILLNDDFYTCCQKLEREIKTRCFALADILARLHNAVFELDLPSEVHVELFRAMAEIETRLAIGCSDRIQLADLVGAFTKARHVMTAITEAGGDE